MTNSADPDQKPTDLDLQCLQRQCISGLSIRRVNQTVWMCRLIWYPLEVSCWGCSYKFPQYMFSCRNEKLFILILSLTTTMTGTAKAFFNQRVLIFFLFLTVGGMSTFGHFSEKKNAGFKTGSLPAKFLKPWSDTNTTMSVIYPGANQFVGFIPYNMIDNFNLLI